VHEPRDALELEGQQVQLQVRRLLTLAMVPAQLRLDVEVAVNVPRWRTITTRQR
jgi:hypothetical protein